MATVKQFWDARADDPSLDQAQVTHPDIWQRWLEIEMVEPFLRPTDHVVDIGCGSGYATKKLAPRVASIVGLDYSEGMIERASAEVPANASFKAGDVLELSPATGQFDVAITLRCLINLPTWEAQQAAIANIAGIVRPGGRYIFVEGNKDGRDGLNAARRQHGLELMPPVWHNLDFDRGRTLDFVSKYFTVESELGFGLYDLISRVAHPLLVAPESPRYEAKLNEIAARLAATTQACNDVSRVLFLVLQRRKN